jgi:hypothetical protein
MKPLSQQLHERSGGDALAPRLDPAVVARAFGAVSPPNSPLPMAEQFRPSSMPVIRPARNEQPKTSILARLLQLKPEEPELKDRLRLLIAELGPLLAEADELEQVITEQRMKSLKAQHLEIRKLGRRHSAVLAQLQQESANAELFLRNLLLAQEGASTALRNMRDMEQRGQHVVRWASDEELGQWEAEIAKAKQRINKANEKVADAVLARNQAHALAEAGEKEMARIGQEEIRLRNEITGQPYTDPEFGLAVPAA